MYRRTGAALLSALVVLSGPPPLPSTILSHLGVDAASNIAAIHNIGYEANTYGAALAATSPNPAIIEGTARVSDGDTLVVGKERIRLYGMDAPEKAQACKDAAGRDYACGLVSKKALEDHVGSQSVRCEVKTIDQYGRNVASCSLAGNLLSGPEDLGQYMVSNGLAVAYRQYGKEYVALEESAHAAHRGIWAGSFTQPSEWRKAQKAGSLGVEVATASTPSIPSTSSTPNFSLLPSMLAAVTAQAPAPMPAPATVGGSSDSNIPCKNGGIARIKGNIGSGGEKIYHMPGGKSYELVKIDPKAGERYFCSEAEAEAAGWRAAKA